MSAISPRVQSEIESANQSGRVPVVFIHGLWLLPSAWAPWAEYFEAHGYAPVVADWPGDRASVDEARANPSAVSGQAVGNTLDHLRAVVEALHERPVLVGHSFGGLFAQMLAAEGLARTTVALSPAQFQGVLPLPLSAIRSALPILGAPWTWGGAIQLTEAQFRYGWSNALDDRESAELYARYHVPAPTRPLLAAATANFNPWASTKVDVHAENRGPLLLIAGEADHTVPVSVVRAAYRLQSRNAALTSFEVLEGRGHSLPIDSGWLEVAERSLAFVQGSVDTIQPMRRSRGEAAAVV